MYIHHMIHDQAKISTMIHEIIETINAILELGLEHNQIMSIEAGIYGTLSGAGVDLSPLLKCIDKTEEKPCRQRGKKK